MTPRIPSNTKSALVARVRAAQARGEDVGPLIQGAAAQFGVHPCTIRRWCRGAGLSRGRSTESLSRDQLVVLAQHQGNGVAAHAALVADGLTLSYSQFMRRLANTDTDLQAAVREGMKAALQAGLYNVQSGSYRRGEIFGYDHTEIPVWTMNPGAPARKKLWISVCKCWGTGVIFRPVFTEGDGVGADPNTEAIVALVGSVLIGQTLDGVRVGGCPKLFVFDNASAHVAEACTNGYAALPLETHVIRKGSPWENGATENTIGVLEKRIWRALPGYTHHLDTRYGRFPWDDEQLLTPEELIARTVSGIEKINRDDPLKRLDGRSRLQAWSTDPRLVEFADPALVRHAFLASKQEAYKIHKSGVHFRKVWYQDTAFAGKVGRHVSIRYLPNDRSFVDVYLNNEYLCTARPASSLTLTERSELARLRRNRVARADRILKRGAKRAADAAAAEHSEAAFDSECAPQDSGDAEDLRIYLERVGDSDE